ncbi:MAG: OmpA family protein [Bacteroidota bacterium]
MKKALILFVFSTVCSAMTGQSKREWLQYADEAFEKEAYSTAAAFYLKVLGDTSGSSVKAIFPQEVRYYEPPPKTEDTTANEQLVKDTSAIRMPDSLLVKKDSVKKDEVKNILADIRMQYVLHQVAECYRLSHNYQKAEEWFAQATRNTSPQYPYERFYYAEALMKNGKYDLAIAEFELFVKEYGKPDAYISKRAEKLMLGCHLAMDSTLHKKYIEVEELDTLINKGSATFGAAYFGEETRMIFTSARMGGKVAENKPENSYYLCDLYTAEQSDKGWSSVKNVGHPVNTGVHEGAGTLSGDKTRLYFTRWSGGDNKECAIYVSKLINGVWLEPMRLNANVNVAGYRAMHPSLSPDESILFFSSDRPGGQGKMDIWYCTIDDLGNAGPAYNLGPRINTPEDELTPYYNYFTQTLYFSSEGQLGFGGLDIFKAYKSDTTWTIPKNLGKPINSSRDDYYFILTKDEQSGFLSSDRDQCEKCNGGNNCLKVYAVKNEPIIITISGTVYNEETMEPLPNTLITFKDIKGEQDAFFIITDENGSYSSILHEDMEIYLKTQKSKFFGDAATISTAGFTKSQNIKQDFKLKPIPKGDIVIPGIEYDYDKATLRPESKKILDDLVDFLNLNDNIVIEISSHTDSRGSDEYNMKLSQERAKSVVDYLISKGIDPKRMVAQGYGETKPLVTDEEVAKMKKNDEKEAAYQKNRRTAFRILSEDFKEIDPNKLKKKQ